VPVLCPLARPPKLQHRLFKLDRGIADFMAPMCRSELCASWQYRMFDGQFKNVYWFNEVSSAMNSRRPAVLMLPRLFANFLKHLSFAWPICGRLAFSCCFANHSNTSKCQKSRIQWRTIVRYALICCVQLTVTLLISRIRRITGTKKLNSSAGTILI
jgi:hypothetical protein